MSWRPSVNLMKRLLGYHIPPEGHLTAVIRRGHIISIGRNNRSKTHTAAHWAGFPYCSIHSEVAAILRTRDPSRCRIVNLRLTRGGVPGYCRPCSLCLAFLRRAGIREAWFIGPGGEFTKEVLHVC